MSEGSKGGWKLVFRDDEIDTLKEVLAYAIDRHDYKLGKCTENIDLMAHRVAKARVKEILDYVVSTTG